MLHYLADRTYIRSGFCFMKKVLSRILVIAFVVFVFDWGIMGIKLLDANYDILVEAYIGLVCFVVIVICAILRVFLLRCLYCKRIIPFSGKYCTYCGREI